MSEPPTYAEVIADIEDSVRDVLSDNPDVAEDEAFHDLLISRLYDSDIPKEVRRDLVRCQLGWDPEVDADLYALYGIGEP